MDGNKKTTTDPEVIGDDDDGNSAENIDDKAIGDRDACVSEEKSPMKEAVTNIQCSSESVTNLAENKNGPENLAAADEIVEDKDQDQKNLDQYNEIAEKLATGCLGKHLPHIQHSKEQLGQLTESQRVLIETIHQENQKFGECQTLTDVTDIMDKAKVYLGKLTKIKKEMFALHEKSAKLKRRALKIQQEKMKEELQREHQKEREFERERQLIAQPAARKADSKPSTNTSIDTPAPTSAKPETTFKISTEESSSSTISVSDSSQIGASNVI